MLLSSTPTTTYTHTCRFNGYFPGKPGLASFPLDSQCPVIHRHPNRTGRNSWYALFWSRQMGLPTGYFGLIPAHLHDTTNMTMSQGSLSSALQTVQLTVNTPGSAPFQSSYWLWEHIYHLRTGRTGQTNLHLSCYSNDRQSEQTKTCSWCCHYDQQQAALLPALHTMAVNYNKW